MGIKYFFGWMKKTFSSHIKTVKIGQDLKQIVDVDHFLVDMNGIFHYCCQKTYQYGAFKPRHEPLLHKKTTSLQKQKQLVEMIGMYIDKLITFVKPNKTIVLAIDGVAPVSKQIQQRSRRYRSAKENDDGVFDSNSITPGTVFLDHISKYLDWFIRKKISEKAWGDVNVIFSSEKVPGEGEHKLVKYVRDFGDEKDTYMIQGMDADLVMLALATHFPKFHILRDNPARYENEYFYIDISSIRENLVNAFLCEQSLLNDNIHINDFIMMIFLTGNDFLPQLPTIEILEGGVDYMFDTYRTVIKSYGSLTNNVGTIQAKALQVFLGTLGEYQIQYLQQKRKKSINYPDTLLERCTSLGKDGEFLLDWSTYRKEYYKKMNLHTEDEIKNACLEYVEGLQWVLTYYTKGVSDWKWNYPYYYAPFLSDIAESMKIDENKNIKEEKQERNQKQLLKNDRQRYYPYSPFMQLLCVLPQKSKNLLPAPLALLMTSKNLEPYYPTDFEVDMDGKHNSWEGVVLLPQIEFNVIEEEYRKTISIVDEKERKRNMVGKTFLYRYSMISSVYRSFYGDINDCYASSTILAGNI